MLETCSVLAVSVIVVDQTQCVCDVIDSKWCFELLSSLLYFAEVSRFEKLQDLFSFWAKSLAKISCFIQSCLLTFASDIHCPAVFLIVKSVISKYILVFDLFMYVA